MGPDFQYVWQHEQLGTGHAVRMAQEALAGRQGDLLVLYGDTPLIPADTLTALVALRRETGAAAAVLTTRLDDPTGYGRIIRSEAGAFTGIVEHKDANPAERAIGEVNTGVYCFAINQLVPALARISPRNAQGEYYLTDVFSLMTYDGAQIATLETGDALALMGPNDRVGLAGVEHCLKKAINEIWMLQGVTIVDPAQTYIGPLVSIGNDTVIWPGTILLGATKVGSDCVIGPHTRIIDSVVEDGCEVQFSQVLAAHLGPENKVGPFANIRPGTSTASQVKIGDFVELKNVQIAAGSKVPHLTYLGDALVGRKVNIGAGTITCNYDGITKHRTIIEDEVFIGSNANLVAPLVIGSGATVGAGSTITKEVPAHALAIARSRQENLTGWVAPRERDGK
jgi:bifunctional UDP-N-acetylglucosamine pyrophosphorylase/glucosamine-1-phosphate N-acetyltransferase